MTATATAAPEVQPSRPWLVRLTAWPVVIAAMSVGVLLVGLSYRFSATGTAPDVYYGTFWLGVLLGMVPIAARVATGSRTQRAWAVALLGVFSFVPKFLRNPDGPDYHDEYAHWREALDVLATGHLLRPNTLIPIVQYYPGTSGLTSMVQRLTGLSVWHSGELVIFAAHMLALFAIFVLAQTHLGSPAAGAVAALVYALNPSEIYFDTQYAYESIAIALFVWTLALTSLAARAQGRLRVSFTVSALVCAGACVVTHHLTTLFLVLLLFVIAVSGSVRRAAGGGGRIWWLVWAGTTVLAAAWVLIVARPTLTYLSPYLGGSVHELSAMTSRGGSGRQVLAASAEPVWEHGLTALTPLVIGLACLWALLILRREHRRWRADTLMLMAFGLLYFVALPFLLAPLGAEGARRSWAFSFVGLALIGAFVVTRAPARWWTSGPALLVVFVVVLIGGVGAGLNDPYRFPEPFQWGTEANSASAETRTVAEQLAAETGPVRVVTDRYTALELAAYGGFQVSAPSAGFPAWELTQSPTDPDRALVSELVSSHYDYLVVDTRMAEQPAFNGNNYGTGDPLQGKATPLAQLDRLDRVPWAARIMSTQHLRVYRLNLSLLGATLVGGP